MKISKKTKDLLTKVVAIVLAFAAVIGGAALIGGIADSANDDYKKVNLSYTVGEIDKTTGRPVENECAMYTKDIIECTGVELYADFDSDIKYTVHFYNENEEWLSCVDNEGLNLKIEEDMPEDAFGVRIVIYPQSDENSKISLFEKGTYANQLTVKVTTKEIKTDTAA